MEYQKQPLDGQGQIDNLTLGIIDNIQILR
jgi:hypothetical protein